MKRACGRIEWASLLRRIYLEDVLACPCGGRRRILADIGRHAHRDAIVAVLAHLGPASVYIDPLPLCDDAREVAASTPSARSGAAQGSISERKEVRPRVS